MICQKHGLPFKVETVERDWGTHIDEYCPKCREEMLEGVQEMATESVRRAFEGVDLAGEVAE